MSSTIYVNNLTTASGSTITVPSGKIIHQGGAVLQTVTFEPDPTTSNQVSISSSGTWTNTGNTATITPKFATSKILIEIHEPMHGDSDQDGHNEYAGWRLYRGSSTVLKYFAYGGSENLTILTARAGQSAVTTMSTIHYDSPATTSAVTYKTMVNRYSGGNRSLRINWTNTQSMTLMEIAQ
jgi:hypothetical protein